MWQLGDQEAGIRAGEYGFSVIGAEVAGHGAGKGSLIETVLLKADRETSHRPAALSLEQGSTELIKRFETTLLAKPSEVGHELRTGSAHGIVVAGCAAGLIEYGTKPLLRSQVELVRLETGIESRQLVRRESRQRIARSGLQIGPTRRWPLDKHGQGENLGN